MAEQSLPQTGPRWRLLELNCGLPSSRFLAIQEEGKKPVWEPDWRRLEPLALEEGFASMQPNTIGDRHGKWRDEPLPERAPAEPGEGR